MSPTLDSPEYGFLSAPKISPQDDESPLSKQVNQIRQDRRNYEESFKGTIFRLLDEISPRRDFEHLDSYYHIKEDLQVLIPLKDTFAEVDSLVATNPGSIRGEEAEVLAMLQEKREMDLLLTNQAKQYATTEFSRMDVDKDGWLSVPEMMLNEKAASGNEKILADYLLAREQDIARLSPDKSRGFFERNSSLEHGFSQKDVDAMSPQTMTDAAIANYYLESRMPKPDTSGIRGWDTPIYEWCGKASGIRRGLSDYEQNGAGIAKFLRATAGLPRSD